MSRIEPIFFHLLINAGLSFIAGLLIVSGVIRVFHIPTSRLKLALLMLPFLKIVLDLTRGIPEKSLLWTGLDPLNLPPRSRFLNISLGVSEYGPMIQTFFTAKLGEGKDTYTISLAEFLRATLNHLNTTLPGLLTATTLLISIALLSRRIYQWYRFGQARKRDRTNAQALSRERIGPRTVDVYASKNYLGTPFTGGIFRPYVCFPLATLEKLSPEEREAVLRHELAHVGHFDLLATGFVSVLGDLFWFIPGYRWLSKKIDELRELLADSSAARSGANASQLASALVRIGEVTLNARQPVLYSAFIRRRSLLRSRVEALVHADTHPGSTRGTILNAVILVATTGAVFMATLGGNPKLIQNPPWAEAINERVTHMLEYFLGPSER